MDALGRLHEELSELVMERIEENPEVQEIWQEVGQRI